MRHMSIDIETYSSIDLAKCGVYAYAAAEDFEVLLFAYAFDYGEVHIVDLARGEKLSREILGALRDERVIKTAFNANFERVCLSSYLKEPLSVVSWRCTAVHAAMVGLPLDLEGAALALNLHVRKMKEGKDLIRYFSQPCKPLKANGERRRNLPVHAPDKWVLFKEYCLRDVEVEMSIREALEKYPVPSLEQELWVLDQKINDTGIRVDYKLVQNAINIDMNYKCRLKGEMANMTGLRNPNSVPELKKWFRDNGLDVKDLSKKTVHTLAESAKGDIERMLHLRMDTSKTSVKKYEAIKRSVSSDNRVRGLFQFYGANRTGRWSGKLVQVQNLPQNKIKDIELARNLVKCSNMEEMELLYESVPKVLSELIRTAFIPSEGHRFLVADFSAIEARILAYLSGEKWRMDVFKGHGRIYEASASQMFKVPIEKITKASPLRQKGKVAELALGYQGGVNALIAMGAMDMGLKEEELPVLVKAWRAANSKIAGYWRHVEDAALNAVKYKMPSKVGLVKLHMEGGILFITLPSGRNLSYIRPGVEEDPYYGRECLTYEGVDQTSRKWTRMSTYGGKLTENIVQAVARDCLGEAMLRVDKAGYHIVMHVHDEIVIDAPEGFGTVEDVCSIMGQPIPWAEGLILKAEGFEASFYRKD